MIDSKYSRPIAVLLLHIMIAHCTSVNKGNLVVVCRSSDNLADCSLSSTSYPISSKVNSGELPFVYQRNRFFFPDVRQKKKKNVKEMPTVKQMCLQEKKNQRMANLFCIRTSVQGYLTSPRISCFWSHTFQLLDISKQTDALCITNN